MKAIITVGISGSGKSTWADEEVDGIVINRDNMRWLVSGKKGWNGSNAYKFNSKLEAHVTQRNDDLLVQASLHRYDVIIADTNLNPKTRNKLINRCKELGYEVEIKEFPISYQEALRRDKERGIFSVGEEVLYNQWCAWCKYWEDKQNGSW